LTNGFSKNFLINIKNGQKAENVKHAVYILKDTFKIQQLIIEIVLSCGTKCGKVQYQATLDAAGNALERHIR
jgi:hypothetical protein